MGEQEWANRNGRTGMGEQEWVNRNGRTAMGEQEWANSRSPLRLWSIYLKIAVIEPITPEPV